jgi:hypothetical protein
MLRKSFLAMVGMSLGMNGLAIGAQATEVIGTTGSDYKPAEVAPTAPTLACPTAEEIEKKAAPYRKLIKEYWMNDSLFMYAEVGNVISAQVDTALNGTLRNKISSFVAGKPGTTASEIRTALEDVAGNTSAYADSLVTKCQHPIYWHNPVFAVSEKEPRKISVTIPTTSKDFPLTFELGADKSADEAKIKASIKANIDGRIALALRTPGQVTVEYHSEKEFLTQHESVAERCFGVSDSSRSTQLKKPEDTGKPVTTNMTSRGRKENSPVMGFPTSEHGPSTVDSPYGSWNGRPETFNPYNPGFGKMYMGGMGGMGAGGAF